MSQAFPVQLLAKSGITLIMCARSRASKLDGVSAKACAEARCGECARLGAGSGRAGGTAAAHTHRSCRERERRQRENLSRGLKHCVSEILQALYCALIKITSFFKRKQALQSAAALKRMLSSQFWRCSLHYEQHKLQLLSI